MKQNDTLKDFMSEVQNLISIDESQTGSPEALYLTISSNKVLYLNYLLDKVLFLAHDHYRNKELQETIFRAKDEYFPLVENNRSDSLCLKSDSIIYLKISMLNAILDYTRIET